jgi:elongation factor Ts
MNTLSSVKSLREKTGAGLMLCKEALEVSGNDEAKAIVWLRQKGIAIADGKIGKPTTEGTVGHYIHTGGRIGVLVEVLCESDFVARTTEFQELVRNLGMQIAACPIVAYTSQEDVPESVIADETQVEMGKEDLAKKPEAIRAKIVEGRIAKRVKELCLLDQQFVKDSTVTVGDYVKEVSGKLGENIKVGRFSRLVLGE